MSPLVGEIPAEAISADGTFTTSGHLNLPDAGVYVVRERLTATYTIPRYVPGTDEVTPGTTWVWPDDAPFQPPFGTNTFVDLNGNGVGPELGVYIDSNGNGVRDDNVWVDRNGNGIQDLLGYVDGNDNGIQDPTEPGYAPETGYTEPRVDEPAGVVGPTEEGCRKCKPVSSTRCWKVSRRVTWSRLMVCRWRRCVPVTRPRWSVACTGMIR